MDFIIELIGTLIIELLFEGAFSIITNKKVSLWIRIPILIIIVVLFVTVIFGIIGIGISFIKSNLLVALFLILVGLIILVASIIQFRKQYLEYKNKESNKDRTITM